jgi:hypothetical protein
MRKRAALSPIPQGLSPTNFGDVLDGSLHGYWGFEPYNGPEFRLENTHPQHWQLVDEDQQALIAGHDDLVHLETENAACVDSILLQKPTGETVKADWKSTGPNQVAVTVPLKKVKPGALKLLVKQYGSKEPDTVPLQAFAQAGHLDSFTIHAGDLSGVLKGSHLDEVKELTLNGVSFKPDSPASTGGAEELSLATANVKAAGGAKGGRRGDCQGRSQGRPRSQPRNHGGESPRPKVMLIGKSIQPSASNAASNIQLADPDELPQNAQLTFSIHAQIPAAFSGNEKIEVATIRGAYLTTLTLASGLTLEDSQVAVATLDTGKAFASSASGPASLPRHRGGRCERLAASRHAGSLPVFRDLKCPDSPDRPCKLTGSKLFLVDSIANDPQFDHPIQVPEGFPGYILTVPHPIGGQLYVKLHDDPSVVNSEVFPSEAMPPPPCSAPAASSEPAEQTPEPQAADAQSNPSAAATAGPTTAGQSSTPSLTAPPITDQAPQSGARAATPPGSSAPASSQERSLASAPLAPTRASSASGTPAVSDSTANIPAKEPK